MTLKKHKADLAKMGASEKNQFSAQALVSEFVYNILIKEPNQSYFIRQAIEEKIEREEKKCGK